MNQDILSVIHLAVYTFLSPFTLRLLSLILFPFTNETTLHLKRKGLHTNEESPLAEEHAFSK